jgi:hypothetical protein
MGNGDKLSTVSGTMFTEGGAMRERHIILAVLILLGLGVKAISFTALTAEAASRSNGIAIEDVSRIHQNIRSLPDESFHDMTLVFPAFPGGD